MNRHLSGALVARSPLLTTFETMAILSPISFQCSPLIIHRLGLWSIQFSWLLSMTDCPESRLAGVPGSEFLLRGFNFLLLKQSQSIGRVNIFRMMQSDRPSDFFLQAPKNRVTKYVSSNAELYTRISCANSSNLYWYSDTESICFRLSIWRSNKEYWSLSYFANTRSHSLAQSLMHPFHSIVWSQVAACPLKFNAANRVFNDGWMA